MFNSLDVLDDLVPVSELSNGRTTAVLNKADRAPVIIIKRNKPSYVLMGINDYQDLLDRLEDTEDARLAEKRIEDNNGRATIPNADLMAELGLTEEDIADTPTPETTCPPGMARAMAFHSPCRSDWTMMLRPNPISRTAMVFAQ